MLSLAEGLADCLNAQLLIDSAQGGFPQEQFTKLKLCRVLVGSPGTEVTASERRCRVCQTIAVALTLCKAMRVCLCQGVMRLQLDCPACGLGQQALTCYCLSAFADLSKTIH